MLLFVLLTAVLSAFLDNVTTVLLIGPMTLTVCKLLDINPIPFFMTEILASNIGGTATLIGDPPNIMIDPWPGAMRRRSRRSRGRRCAARRTPRRRA